MSAEIPFLVYGILGMTVLIVLTWFWFVDRNQKGKK